MFNFKKTLSKRLGVNAAPLGNCDVIEGMDHFYLIPKEVEDGLRVQSVQKSPFKVQSYEVELGQGGIRLKCFKVNQEYILMFNQEHEMGWVLNVESMKCIQLRANPDPVGLLEELVQVSECPEQQPFTVVYSSLMVY